MTIDRRYKLRKQGDRAIRDWLSILVLFVILVSWTAIVHAETIEPVSPLGEPLEKSNSVTQVETGEVKTSPQPLTIEEKIMRAWGKVEGPRAWKIVSECENKNINPYAINWNSNGTHDVGIFMINSVHGYSDEEMFDVDKNISAAYLIYQRNGWPAWSCSHVINETPFYLL
ncbi:MAG: hypothetical protein DRP97_00515 [Candidatus Latescibacterota bacterium]|nr:MAG: hypothetical protein DRP97_00515 [Candidatus Latescibacterota bacterium]